MNINRPLVPGWLKKADQKLLLTKPGIWSTRTHLVVYYGILFILFLAVLCFLENSDPRARTTSPYWIGFVSIISIIGLTVWLIYLLRFNVFKKYGILHPRYSLTSFILYFISTGIIVLFTYVPPAVESIRANMAYGDEEVVQDMNAINLKLCQLEYDLLRVKWDSDSVIVRKNTGRTEPRNVEYYDEVAIVVADSVATAPGRYLILDTVEFSRRLAATDSVIKVNDSFYILYRTPQYAFISNYVADNDTKTKLLSSFDIYNMVFKNPPPANRAAISKELVPLLKKYHYQEQLESYRHNEEITYRDGPFEIMHKRYHLYEIDRNFSNLVSKKYQWSRDNMPVYMRIFYYVTLGITLLIFIFRHTTVRTFFLSLLTAVLLIIFTAFMLSMSGYDESDFMAWMIAYFLVFCIGASYTWMQSRRSGITGIMVNLFVFLAPIFPLLPVGWYYAMKSEQRYMPGAVVDLTHMDDHIFYAEIGGSLLFLILSATYIHKMYRRWFSLPEE